MRNLFYSFRFDDFDYDSISLDEDLTFDNASHRHKIASLSRTLKIPTYENITNLIPKDSTRSFLSKDNFLFDSSSSDSLLPDRIPLGLCSSYLSEDTIPDISSYSSLELIDHIPELSEETEYKQSYQDYDNQKDVRSDEQDQLLDMNLNNYRDDIWPELYKQEINIHKLHNTNWYIKPNKTVSTHGFQSDIGSDLELVNSAPVISSLTESLVANDDKKKGLKKEYSRLKMSDNSFSNCILDNQGISVLTIINNICLKIF
jgi:hypothetical protein